MGSTPKAPEAPDYAAANREAIQADVETLPQRLRTQQEAELGIGQFQGLGREAQLNQLLDLYAKSAPQVSQIELQNAQQYDPQRIALARQNLQLSDPTRFALQESYTQQALNDLNLGSQLSDSQRREAEQNIRKAQQSRGNVFGINPAIDEAIAKYDLGEKMKAQRQGVAASALGFSVPSQFGSLSQAQQGATQFRPIAPELPFGVNPNAGQLGTSFALGRYQQQSANWNSQVQQGNPFLSAGVGLVGTLGGAALGNTSIFCWVAREVYGENNPDWMKFRDWMFVSAPAWFFKLYWKFGEKFAQFIKDKPIIKKIIKKMMDKVIYG